MANQDDARYRKSETAIMETFIELLPERGFEEITVKDLIARAGVNRSTFYSHYADKYELIDRVEDLLLDDLAELLVQAPVREHVSAVAEPDWLVRSYFARVAKFLESNGILFNLLLGPRGRPEFALKMSRMIHHTWSTRQLTPHATVPINYAYAAFTGVIVNLLTEWARNGFQQTSDEFVAIAMHITRDLPGRLFDLRTLDEPYRARAAAPPSQPDEE